MSIPASAIPLLLGSTATTAYNVQRSLRFNSIDSAYLSRTPSVAGNRKTWTWAGWVKISGDRRFFSVGTTAVNDVSLGFYGGRIDCFNREGGNINARIVSDAAYRDPSAWYHFLCVWDTTAVAPSDRFQVWINGDRVTSFPTANYPSPNLDGICNTGLTHYIGSQTLAAGEYFSGYLADIHFIDGQALDPTSFGEFDANGVWQPKAYTGTYGTNGFHLPFSDNSTAAALGTDTSGNSNNWTVNNISVAAGAGNDSLVDTPTSYGEDDGLGGSVRGNYCTLNPLAAVPAGASLSNGNLDGVTPTDGLVGITGTFAIPASGKWYWEVVETSGSAGGFYGIATAYNYTPGVIYYGTGAKYVDGGSSAYGASYGVGDVIGVAVNVDAGTVTFYKNNVSQGAITYTTAAGLFPYFCDGSSGASNGFTANFGQRPFAYAAPSGFKALCDTNLPAPVVAKPSEVMDVKLYTGNGSTQTISGLGFSPDLVWTKARSYAYEHIWSDTVRGANKQIRSNSTDAELSLTDAITAFTSDGFTVGANGGTNYGSTTYAAFCWDAGSSTVSNPDGSITSQVRANASAGFSIVTYTGTGANATVGHGLNVAPSMIIVKSRNAANNWAVYHAFNTSDPKTDYLLLNSTAATADDNTYWNDTAPTSTVFSVGTNADVNTNGTTYVAYCMAPVANYSAFGVYTGNGVDNDGPFVWCGFRPRLVLVKNRSATSSWHLLDSARSPYNSIGAPLYPNASGIGDDSPANLMDFVSNGFKVRLFNNVRLNATSNVYVWAAFAESPFQYARAR